MASVLNRCTNLRHYNVIFNLRTNVLSIYSTLSFGNSKLSTFSSGQNSNNNNRNYKHLKLNLNNTCHHGLRQVRHNLLIPCSQRQISHSSLRKSVKEDATHPIQFSKKDSPNLEGLNPDEKADIFNRPKAQTTIDEEEVSKFADLSALWWDEGGEFEALHSLNDLRVPLIRDGLVVGKKLDEYKMSKPLEDCWILDVGSGGGLLSEPLARLGANVVGLEAAEENIKIAQAHLMHDPEIRDRLKYIHATVESIVEEQAGKFDAVVASEVLEHVAEPETFVTSCCQLVRPGGSVFFTTLNKTNLSYALGIVMAERVLGLVSPGTHDWNKFIPPRDLQYMIEQNGFTCQLIHGMWYNPLTKRWTWTKDTSINYAVHAVKTSTEPENVWTQDKK